MVSAAGYKSKTSAAVTVTGNPLPVLLGNITISPTNNVTTGTELTATYSGEETVNYQWKKDGNNVGSNSNKFTPTAAGSYTVTVSAAGYKSKTSAAVKVTAPSGGGGGMTWTAVTPDDSFTLYDIYAIAYGNNRFVAVNDGLFCIGTSTNGTEWRGLSDVPIINLNFISNTIAYGNNIFVAVTDGLTGTSTNGTRWRSPPIAYGMSYNAIAYGNNMFVAGDNRGRKIVSSNNGTTWNSGNIISESFKINAIAYGDNKFVAVGESSMMGISKMEYSSNGTTWTAVEESTFDYNIDTINNRYHQIYAIAYGNNIFVAGGSNGKMETSPDGITWTTVTNSAFSFDGSYTYGIYAIAYGNNKFVAGGNSGKMATSPDGVTWTAIANSPFSFDGGDILAIAYGNNKFVAGGAYGKMATSPDGVTWTAVANSAFSSDDRINAIAYGNNKFVAGGTNGKIAYSPDGVTWTATTTDIFDFNLWDERDESITVVKGWINAIAYGNNKFVAGGPCGQIAYWSGN